MMEAVSQLLEPYKACGRCRRVLPVISFHRDPTKVAGLNSHCRRCKEYRRRARQWRGTKYGLTREEYLELAHRQGGVCAICNRPETISDGHGGVRPLSIDHDHSTGVVRGLLCHGCNVALGHMCDDIELLRAAIEYLESRR